jgi:hypothetical protein
MKTCVVRAWRGERATLVGGAFGIHGDFGIQPDRGQAGFAGNSKPDKASFDDPEETRIVIKARFDQMVEAAGTVRGEARVSPAGQSASVVSMRRGTDLALADSTPCPLDRVLRPSDRRAAQRAPARTRGQVRPAKRTAANHRGDSRRYSPKERHEMECIGRPPSRSRYPIGCAAVCERSKIQSAAYLRRERVSLRSAMAVCWLAAGPATVTIIDSLLRMTAAFHPPISGTTNPFVPSSGIAL